MRSQHFKRIDKNNVVWAYRATNLKSQVFTLFRTNTATGKTTKKRATFEKSGSVFDYERIPEHEYNLLVPDETPEEEKIYQGSLSGHYVRQDDKGVVWLYRIVDRKPNANTVKRTNTATGEEKTERKKDTYLAWLVRECHPITAEGYRDGRQRARL